MPNGKVEVNITFRTSQTLENAWAIWSLRMDHTVSPGFLSYSISKKIKHPMLRNLNYSDTLKKLGRSFFSFMGWIFKTIPTIATQIPTSLPCLLNGEKYENRKCRNGRACCTICCPRECWVVKKCLTKFSSFTLSLFRIYRPALLQSIDILRTS